MEDLKGQAFIRQKLKPQFLAYGAVVTLFLGALCFSLILRDWASSLTRDVENLRQTATNLAQVPQTVANVNSFIAQTSLTVPADISTEQPVHFLHLGLDRIKMFMSGGQLTVGKMEERGEEIIMPITLTGQVRDYAAFLSALGRLQEMAFPFFAAKGLVLKMNRDNNSDMVSAYEIRGDLTTPKAGQGQGSPSIRARMRRQ